MTKENNMKEELLKQMDKDSVESTDVNVNSARKTIEKYKAQLRKLKWITAISWLLVIWYVLAMHDLKVFLLNDSLDNVLTRDEFWLIRLSDLGLLILTLIAILLTYLVYSTSRTLTIQQINARLANIEEQLKKMSQDK